MSTDIDRMRQAQPAGRSPSAAGNGGRRLSSPPALSDDAARQDRLDNAEFDKQALDYSKPTTQRPALIVEDEIELLRRTYTLGATRLEMLTKVKNIREAVYQEQQGEDPILPVSAADHAKAETFFRDHGTRLADEPRKAPPNPLKPAPAAAAAAPAPKAPEPSAAPAPTPEARPQVTQPPGTAPASLKIEYVSVQGFRCELTLQAPTSTLVLEQGGAAMAKLVQQQAKPAPVATAAGHSRAESGGDEAKVCPVHKKPMKENRFKWFCPEKDDQQENGYCAYEVAKKKR